MGSGFWYEAGSLLPSLGVGVIFFFALRAILRADRGEREADREAERELRAMAERDAEANSRHSSE